MEIGDLGSISNLSIQSLVNYNINDDKFMNNNKTDL